MTGDFADRHGFRPPQPRRIFENVPYEVRGELFLAVRNICQVVDQEQDTEFTDYMDDEGIDVKLRMEQTWYDATFDIPEVQRSHTHKGEPDLSQLESILMVPEPWWLFFVSVERLINRLNPPEDVGANWVAERLSTTLNAHFSDLGIGYELRRVEREGWLLHKVGSQEIETVIQEAKALLADPKFTGPASAWAKAAKLLTPSGPPNYPQAALQSVHALEGFCRLVEQDEKALLSDIVAKWRKAGKIKPPLDGLFDKLYAFRGNEPGVAHGPTKLPNVTFEEAELVLGVAANLIVYAARIHGIATK